jgi:hypothetical protein
MLNLEKIKKKFTNRNKRILGVILLIVFIIIFLNYQSYLLANFWFIILFIILESYLFGEGFTEIIKVFLMLTAIGFLITIITAWKTPNGQFFGFTVNNEFMLVLLTSIYVIATIVNVLSFRNYSQLNRLPYLKLEVCDDLDISIKNSSEKIAKDVDTTIKLFKINESKPSLKKSSKKLKEKKICHKVIRIDILEQEGYIDTQKIFEEVLPVKKYCPSGYDDKTYKLEKGVDKFKVKLKISCNYHSDTGFSTYEPLEKEVTILFDKKRADIEEPEKEYGDGYDIT